MGTAYSKKKPEANRFIFYHLAVNCGWGLPQILPLYVASNRGGACFKGNKQIATDIFGPDVAPKDRTNLRVALLRLTTGEDATLLVSEERHAIPNTSPVAYYANGALLRTLRVNPKLLVAPSWATAEEDFEVEEVSEQNTLEEKTDIPPEEPETIEAPKEEVVSTLESTPKNVQRHALLRAALADEMFLPTKGPFASCEPPKLREAFFTAYKDTSAVKHVVGALSKQDSTIVLTQLMGSACENAPVNFVSERDPLSSVSRLMRETHADLLALARQLTTSEMLNVILHGELPQDTAAELTDLDF